MPSGNTDQANDMSSIAFVVACLRQSFAAALALNGAANALELYAKNTPIRDRAAFRFRPAPQQQFEFFFPTNEVGQADCMESYGLDARSLF